MKIFQIRTFIIFLTILVGLFAAPFIVVPLLNNNKLDALADEFNKREFATKELPLHTSIINKYYELSRPVSSNSCSLFAGVLLSTRLAFPDVVDYYPDSHVAWVRYDHIVINRDIGGENIKYSYDCNTCFPVGLMELRNLLSVNNLRGEVNYVVIYEEEVINSNFDWRCN